jgi:methylglutaconyl-CoA hydratase
MVNQHRSHHLLVERTGPGGEVLRVRLNRPEVHNALNGALIQELRECFASVNREDTRALVLSGEGRSFCAGADLNWMRASREWTHEQHVADAGQLAEMLAALNACVVPAVARVHGAALGGALGLLACCDIVVAAEDTKFGFTEAKLGLLPAVIAPFVVAKTGQSHARALFVTAERFDAQRALQIGLVHRVVPAGQLDEAVEVVVRELLTSAPEAAAQARELVARVQGQTPESVRDYTVTLNARLRAGAEGQEGMASFLEKRNPSWAEDPTKAEGRKTSASRSNRPASI